METCVNTVARVYSLAPIISFTSVSTKIKDSRDMVEHMNEKIQGGVWGPTGLDPSEDAAVFKIFFRDKYRKRKEEILELNTQHLADEIVRLHTILTNELSQAPSAG